MKKQATERSRLMQSNVIIGNTWQQLLYEVSTIKLIEEKATTSKLD
jgi:hypothetical protein